MNGIEIKDLTKHYGKVQALHHVNLQFEKNKIYALLGRNGAGKTTLLNIISNRIFADSGETLVDGKASAENDEALVKLYMMSEQTYYPPNVKLETLFAYTKHFYPKFDMTYALGLAEQFELDINKKVRSLSTGFETIFKIIIALSVNTPYLFLDEPVLGMDANNRELFYKILLEKYSNHPCTIVISTHLIEEVANIVENIVIIKKGEIIRNESRDDLLANGYSISGAASLVDAYCTGKQVIGRDVLGGLKSAYIIGTPDTEIAEGLELSGIDLQKLFVQLTNA